MRIASGPETEATGFAGRNGEIWGESVPSISGVGPVIGDRGEDRALSVFFEETEDLAWFAPHLVELGARVRARSRRLPPVLLTALVLATAPALAGIGRPTIRRLSVVRAATPCLPVRNYVTSGTYPNVRGSSKAVARANLALRRAVLTDQRTYAQSARRHTAQNASGAYETAIDPNLTSASSVVVSALIPALKLYPGATQGQTWIATTVDLRTGRTVSLRELLANPPLALPALVQEWKARVRQTTQGASLVRNWNSYTPTFAHYRYFALTPAGLAFGFAQEPAGSRFAAAIPYRLVRPYLSPLGKRLVAGVRKPRATHRRQGELAWISLRRSAPRVTAGWPAACT